LHRRVFREACSTPLPKALQVLRRLTTEQQVLGVEALDLHAGASVIGEVEDVQLTV